MAIEHLTPLQIDNLIDMIATVHKTAIKRIYPILSEIKKDKSKILTSHDWEIIKIWYSNPSETERKDKYKVAKVFTYVVIEKLYPGQMEKNGISLDFI